MICVCINFSLELAPVTNLIVNFSYLNPFDIILPVALCTPDIYVLRYVSAALVFTTVSVFVDNKIII
jgi:hypothetical protein